jgi:predicted small lipoprotein YifL
MSRRIASVLLLVLLATILAACGSKGALVMPDQQTTSKKKHAPTPAPTVPAPAPAASGDSGKPQ